MKELEERGLLRKVHGGAIPRPEAPRVFEGRKEFASQSKVQLVRKALPLLKDGQLILIDGGTTNWQLAEAIPRELRATIFTNSFPVAQSLIDHPSINLNFLGGPVFKASQATVGIEMSDTLRQIRADICFIGVRSIHHKLGLTSLEIEEAHIKRKMIEVSDQMVVMITADKLDTGYHFKICDFQDIDVLIIEDSAEAER